MQVSEDDLKNLEQYFDANKARLLAEMSMNKQAIVDAFEDIVRDAMFNKAVGPRFAQIGDKFINFSKVQTIRKRSIPYIEGDERFERRYLPKDTEIEPDGYSPIVDIIFVSGDTVTLEGWEANAVVALVEKGLCLFAVEQSDEGEETED